MGEWDENRLFCKGSLKLSDLSHGLQSSKEEEVTWDIKAEESPVTIYTSYILQKFQCVYNYLETFPSDDEVMVQLSCKVI